MFRILFLSLCSYCNINQRDIYTDLLREFTEKGDYVVIAAPLEKKYKTAPSIIKNFNCEICQILIDDYFNVGAIKKGISLLTIDYRFRRRLKKQYKNEHFDLVLYATPPIMFNNTIKYFRRSGAKTYLMLKDIFPQNAVDLGMMKKNGIKGLLYNYFRKQEKRLYSISDKIGCMSQANINYLLKHNFEINKCKVEMFPNCIQVDNDPIVLSNNEIKVIRQQYKLPLDKKIFVYGGNLGKPQGVPFIIEFLKAASDIDNLFFLIVGDGAEYERLASYAVECKPSNFKLIRRIPTEEFDRVLESCDIGFLFLDYRFTIPNFPSRMLSYMKASLPIIACTDEATDVGKVITEGGFGWSCYSNDVDALVKIVKSIDYGDDYINKKKNSYNYLKTNYSTSLLYKRLYLND